MSSTHQQDLQDVAQLGVWGTKEELSSGGAMISVRGTGTVDLEVPIMNLGYGFTLPADSNSEIVMLSMGSDVDDKVAMLTIPRDLQHAWAEGTGGIQHPQDADRRVEFNGDETHLRDGKFVIGSNREVTIIVDGTNVVIETAADTTINSGGATIVNSTGDATITAGGNMQLTATDVSITSGTLTHNGVNVGATHVHVDTPGLGAGITTVPQ